MSFCSVTCCCTHLLHIVRIFFMHTMCTKFKCCEPFKGLEGLYSQPSAGMSIFWCSFIFLFLIKCTFLSISRVAGKNPVDKVKRKHSPRPHYYHWAKPSTPSGTVELLSGQQIKVCLFWTVSRSDTVRVWSVTYRKSTRWLSVAIIWKN